MRLDEAVAYTRQMDQLRAQINSLNPDLENRFTYHSPSPDQAKVYTILRGVMKNTAYAIIEETPPSAEQTLALRKLEEAMFWANAAVARSGGDTQ